MRFWLVAFALLSALRPGEAAAAWNSDDARVLARVIAAIGQEGLDPADYDLAGLQSAISGGPAPALDMAADHSFRRLAGDLVQGHVRGPSRIGWYITGPVADTALLDALAARALSEHRVAETLQGLLPQAAGYRALKASLAATPASDSNTRNRLRVNMERWRWLPRSLGERYILVNVPAFAAVLVEGDETIARHRVITGKIASPTPQFNTMVTGVIFNPWWEVPASIVAESIGALMRRHPATARAQGYVRVKLPGGGTRVRQAPGPKNALGQMKLVMPNPYSVYMHDTPSKSLFEKPVRAFSHGCIRVDKPIEFAASLLAGTEGWNREAIDATVAAGTTVKAEIAAPLPAYVTYFTAARADDGSIVHYPDIYKRDEAVIAALTDRDGEGPAE